MPVPFGPKNPLHQFPFSQYYMHHFISKYGDYVVKAQLSHLFL